MSDPAAYARKPYRYWPSASISDDSILDLWRSGFDTFDIAQKLAIPQHEAERRLHRAKDAIAKSSSTTGDAQ